MSLDEKSKSKIALLMQQRKERNGENACKRCGNPKEREDRTRCNRCLMWDSNRKKRLRIAARFVKSKKLDLRDMSDKDIIVSILKAHEEAIERIEKLELENVKLTSYITRKEYAKTFSKSLGIIRLRLENMEKRVMRDYKRAWYMGAKAAKNYLEKPSPENFDPAQTDYDELQQISHVYQSN